MNKITNINSRRNQKRLPNLKAIPKYCGGSPLSPNQHIGFTYILPLQLS